MSFVICVGTYVLKKQVGANFNNCPPNGCSSSSLKSFPCALLTKDCIAYEYSAGTRLAKTAEAIGMHVIGLNSKSSSAQLTSLLQQADVVSIHCPLTPTTRNLIG